MLRRNVIVSVAVVALAACQSSNVSRDLGARCDTGQDCTDRCLPDDGAVASWPGGFCTMSCMTNDECPDGSLCIELAGLDGGVCLLNCVTDLDCAFLGANWVCDLENVIGGLGHTAYVCAGTGEPHV